MDKNLFLNILQKYQKGKATPAEKRFVNSYYELFEMEDEGELSGDELNATLDKLYKTEIEPGITETEIKKSHVKIIALRKIKVVAAAAMVLFILSAGFYLFWFRIHKESAVTDMAEHPTVIKPASTKAILTLANGKRIDLSSIGNGRIAIQGHTKIIKNLNGQIDYSQLQHGKGSLDAKEMYNEVSTPAGGTFRLTLSDGTRVWLNAGSSLKYPIAFDNGRKRLVQLSGEAYFEVKHNSASPFVVEADSMQIQDVGTHFNVMAYQDEGKIKTTLIEGSVKIAVHQRSSLLKPGEEASWNRKSHSLTTQRADTAEVLAWREGLFHYDNTNIKEIMREISRWYDVTTDYRTDKLTNMDFSGVMSRYSDVDDVLKRLAMTGTIQFKIEGRKIIVLEKK